MELLENQAVGFGPGVLGSRILAGGRAPFKGAGGGDQKLEGPGRCGV